MGITWNPADKTAGLTLSNGDLTATKTTTNYENVRATAGYVVGKYYWECTVGDPTTVYDDWYLGVREVNESINTVGLGGDSAGYRVNPGNGTVVRVAVDFTAGNIWLAKDTDPWIGGGDPETDTTPTDTFTPGTEWLPWYGTDNGPSSADAYTTVTFTSPFVYSPPVGFDQFDPAELTVTAITPDTGSTAGGTPVTISGTGFNLPAYIVTSVNIDGNELADWVVVDQNTITGITPEGTVGAKDVNVVTTD